MVIAWSAVFAIAEGTTKAEPVQTQVTRLLTTAPLMPSSIQRLPSASVTWKLPSITVAVMARNPRGLSVLAGAMTLAAALFTRLETGQTFHNAYPIATQLGRE